MPPVPDQEPNVRQVVPFFAVSDMEDSLKFYIDGLGFTLKNKWIVDGKIRWCWLELGKAAIMLQEFFREGHDSWLPQGKLGEGVSIDFQCRDALAIYREIAARGIQVSKPMVGNGEWEMGATDPDGYRINFSSPTDLPEETEYSSNSLNVS